jgi:hypothetical protein
LKQGGQIFNYRFFDSHGLFLEGVYKIELDTKNEYEGFEGFEGTPSYSKTGIF